MMKNLHRFTSTQKDHTLYHKWQLKHGQCNIRVPTMHLLTRIIVIKYTFLLLWHCKWPFYFQWISQRHKVSMRDKNVYQNMKNWTPNWINLPVQAWGADTVDWISELWHESDRQNKHDRKWHHVLFDSKEDMATKYGRIKYLSNLSMGKKILK
jgi:hypothetical protein